jgi:polysaccharide biosynthesis protein PslH
VYAKTPAASKIPWQAMRLLFLTHRVPYPPARGDTVRAYHLLRVLCDVAEIDLVALTTDPDAGAPPQLNDLTASCTLLPVPALGKYVRALSALFGHTPLTHALLASPGAPARLSRLVEKNRPDAAFVFCTGIAPLVLTPALSRLPFVLDMVDVDSEKWRSLADGASWPLCTIYSREHRCLARFETEIARRARATTVVNDRERDALAAIAPGARIEVLPNGIDVTSLEPPTGPSAAPTVVFTGVMNYAPNERGIRWFAREVWPLVRAVRPDARLMVVGAHPTRAVRALATTDGSVTVTGLVPDVRPYLWDAALSIAPLQVARGVQVKVLEAAAARLPCVVTTQVAQGLPREIRQACRIADDAPRFAAEVLALLAATPSERRTLADSAALDGLDWTSRLAGLTTLVADAVAARP